MKECLRQRGVCDFFVHQKLGWPEGAVSAATIPAPLLLPCYLFPGAQQSTGCLRSTINVCKGWCCSSQEAMGHLPAGCTSSLAVRVSVARALAAILWCSLPRAGWQAVGVYICTWAHWVGALKAAKGLKRKRKKANISVCWFLRVRVDQGRGFSVRHSSVHPPSVPSSATDMPCLGNTSLVTFGAS